MPLKIHVRQNTSAGLSKLSLGLQEQGRLVEAPGAPHGKDVLCSTSKDSALGCFADGATEGAKLVLCGKHHPQVHREAVGCFAVGSHSQEQVQCVLHPG